MELFYPSVIEKGYILNSV